ncbi:hypothetical protein [Pediococcus inopinatus]|nr:hypothetical protein [Pediococcus inopinatus]
MGLWLLLALFITAIGCGVMATKQRNKNRPLAIVLTVIMVIALAVVLYLT